MTKKYVLGTRNIEVEIEQRENTDKEETQSIHIWIRDKKTNHVLQSFNMMDSKELNKAWLIDNRHLKTY